MPPSSIVVDDSHDPLQCVKQLRQTLAAPRLSVGFFLGAGCPCAIRVASPEIGGDAPLIPDIEGLTRAVAGKLSASEQHKASFAALMRVLEEDGFEQPTIENFLSRIRSLRDAAGSRDARGLSAGSLDALDSAVCRAISSAVRCDLPDGGTPYHSLAKLVGDHRSPPCEIFTTNYDLLMEQALESRRVPFFDGFVGSCRAFFDQQAIEDDRLPDRWQLLWKVHGSIDWRFNRESRAIYRGPGADDGEELLIHPSHRKYDESRRMPYVIMMDRLKTFLRNEGKPAALFAIGHSFSDEHINATIKESLRANPSGVCFALQYKTLSDYPVAVELAKAHANFNLFAREAAIIRSHQGQWVARPAAEASGLSCAFELPEPDVVGRGGRGGVDRGSPELRDEHRACRFCLGDFKQFGRFVDQFERQIADEVQGP
jgi:SIR2-like domain